jgi:isopentenyl-diphosphate delta-isomerase
VERNNEYVILVNRQDEELGIMPKIEAHQKALLHRAFSVFVMNRKGEVMLQQRAPNKYHSPNLWTNTCCSHQRLGESNIEAGMRRLKEEMGFRTELKEIFSFIYKAPFENGLTEHEFDHVLLGYYEGEPHINPGEVANWKWMLPEDIKMDMEANTSSYTTWFRIIFSRFYDHILQKERGL